MLPIHEDTHIISDGGFTITVERWFSITDEIKNNKLIRQIPIRQTIYKFEDGSVVAYITRFDLAGNVLNLEGMFSELYPELVDLIKKDCGVKDINLFWMR